MYKFELDKEEIKKFETWSNKQKKRDSSIPTLGERFTFLFTPTGLGTVVEVRDNKLKETINLTDYESW